MKNPQTTCHFSELPKNYASSCEKGRYINVQIYLEITENKGISLRFLPTCYYKTAFSATGGRCNQENSQIFIKFLKVCKCGMPCVNFRSVEVYNSAVMEFWPIPLEQRIKLLNSIQ